VDFDYRQLLMKYIYHIGSAEGVTFLNYRVSLFTEEEWQELQRLDEESMVLQMPWEDLK